MDETTEPKRHFYIIENQAGFKQYIKGTFLNRDGDTNIVFDNNEIVAITKNTVYRSEL